MQGGVNRGSDGGLEAFKARLPIVDIVARHVRLIRRGNRHQGLCPFHQEKSPSFYVFEDQGNYHCFGCGAHGTAIDFVMNIEGLPFAEALRRLADLTGIPAPVRDPAAAEARRERIDPLLAANEKAAAWFRRQLGTGSRARDYLAERGVPAELQERFGLGYAPEDRHGLITALEAQGIPVEAQVEAGLAIRPEDGSRAFARFRHRLMFPIKDARGRLVGFGGRALGDAKAKYLNTPETALFLKGSLLYGLDLAMQPAREAKEIFIVEGYLDVIAMHEAGFTNTVAPLGTAVGEAQLELLWRYSEEPYVCLDGDAAGLAAALRMVRRALPVIKGGQTLRFVVLPAGEDPDSLLHGRGREAMLDLVRSAVPLSMMIWQAEHQSMPAETPEQLAGLRRRLLEYVRLTGDPGLRDGLKARFDDLVYGLRRGLGGKRFGASSPAAGPRGAAARRDRATRTRDRGAGAWEGTGRAELKASIQNTERHPFLVLLGAFLDQPALLERFAEEVDGFVLERPLDEARREVLNWLAASAHLDAVSLDSHLTSYGFGRLMAEARTSYKGVSRVSADVGVPLEAELASMLTEHRRRRAAAIEREASASASSGQDVDLLAWKRLDRVLNGGSDED